MGVAVRTSVGSPSWWKGELEHIRRISPYGVFGQAEGMIEGHQTDIGAESHAFGHRGHRSGHGHPARQVTILDEVVLGGPNGRQAERLRLVGGAGHLLHERVEVQQVLEGELHEAFDADGESLKIRNGVGVDEAGRAHFVITAK